MNILVCRCQFYRNKACLLRGCGWNLMLLADNLTVHCKNVENAKESIEKIKSQRSWRLCSEQ